MTAAAVLLAHQGGWDEILLVAGPIVAIGWLLRLARKRVERNGPPVAPSTDPAPPADPPRPPR